MLKDRLMKWAAKAAAEWIEDHGKELAEECLEWLLAKVNSLLLGEELFTAPVPPVGLEEFCELQTALLEAVMEEPDAE